jgi:hypothetical protein
MAKGVLKRGKNCCRACKFVVFVVQGRVRVSDSDLMKTSKQTSHIAPLHINHPTIQSQP